MSIQTSMHVHSAPTGHAEAGSVMALLPIMAVVSIAFLIIGFALPVLPLHVHHELGFSAVVVGVVTGSQFAVSVLTRVWAGRVADARGAKHAVMGGLVASAIAGVLYLASDALVSIPWLSASVLLAGRALLGGAESFIITGAAAWGLALAGPRHAGRVIAWIGMAMFAAMALGAPLGMMLYAHGGFVAVALATVVVPLLALSLVAPLASVKGQHGVPAKLMKVAQMVWLPGLGSALSSLGFGAVLAFSSLLASERGWDPVWLGFSAFACALIAARLFFGHLPDRFGGARVTLACVLIEAAGLAFMWFASGRTIAAIGAALAGFGYALVYPGLGVEAVRRAPAQSRGLAMGAYTVFLDVALGFGTPILGFLADRAGVSAVFLASAALVLCAAGVAVQLLIATDASKPRTAHHAGQIPLKVTPAVHPKAEP